MRIDAIHQCPAIAEVKWRALRMTWRSKYEVEQDGCAEGEPRGVGAHVAGLPALEDRAGEGCDAGEEPGEAAEDGEVDDPLEEVSERRSSGLTMTACRSRRRSTCWTSRL